MIAVYTQTLIIYPNGNIAKRMDHFLYHPTTDRLIINGKEWEIIRQEDEIDSEDWLIRKIYLSQ